MRPLFGLLRLAMWLAGITGSTLVPAFAAGSDALSRDVSTGWLVTPLAPTADITTIKAGEIVFRQRLLPLGYAISGAEAMDSDTGTPVLPKGVPLVRLVSAAGIVECVLTHREAHGVLGAFWIGFTGGDGRVCMQDRDKDGRFESYARYKGLDLGLPSLNGRLPKHMHPLKEPVPYSEQDSSSTELTYFVGLRYQGKGLYGPVFDIVFGHDKDVGNLELAFPRDQDGMGKRAIPGTVLLQGAAIKVFSAEDGVASVKVDRTFPTGVFKLTQFGSNGFY